MVADGIGICGRRAWILLCADCGEEEDVSRSASGHRAAGNERSRLLGLRYWQVFQHAEMPAKRHISGFEPIWHRRDHLHYR